MGWFDKKSWQLRRKVKDLQADLKEAERDGKYVVEQGLFFAELEDMGEMTMMVFGTADHMAAQEESVIKTFFDRNGFSVEIVKMDKDQTSLLDVEILPSEEMTRHVGRLLKADGYRIIDDSEREKAANLPEKIIPLSSLMRGIVLLFSQHVQQVISTSRIKMNKEGNRLLHWMPKIIDTLGKKVKPEVVDILKPSFEDAYEAFYGRVGKLGEITPRSGGDSAMAAPTGADRIPSLAFPASKTGNTAASTVASAPASAPKPAPAATPFAAAAPVTAPQKPTVPAWANTPTPRPTPGAGANAAALSEAIRARDAAETAASMYRSLIGANSNRCVRNSEVLLDEVNRLFNATATCLMVKVPQGDGFTIHANAGKRLAYGDGGEGYPVSSTVLTRCLQQRAAVSNERLGGDPSESMMMHQIEAAAAAPIIVKDHVIGILYVDRRTNPVPFDDQDCKSLLRLSDVFREFPDLVLGHVA